jgi:hypothetical protein
MLSLSNPKRKMARPPVYQDGLFEPNHDPTWNSLDNTFKHEEEIY